MKKKSRIEIAREIVMSVSGRCSAAAAESVRETLALEAEPQALRSSRGRDARRKSLNSSLRRSAAARGEPPALRANEHRRALLLLRARQTATPPTSASVARAGISSIGSN